MMQRLNITSAFRRTVSGHGTGTLSSVQSPLSTVCAWRCSKWSSAVFSLFMISLIRSKSLQEVRIIWSSLSNHIYTYPRPHTYIYIYVLTYQGTWGQSQSSPPFFSHTDISLASLNEFGSKRNVSM